jgi:hypothetical protein
MMQDGEEGNFVNGCYTQEYSNYYSNSSRSRSQEEASSSSQRNVDESYLPGGWYATQNNDGGVWNSLRSSELESSYDGTASAAASASRLSCHSSIEPCSELPLAPTPIHSNNKAAVGRSFEQERDTVAILLDHIDSLESMRQTDSEESQSQQSSLPRNDSLPAEWLTAMHGDNSSIDETASWSASATASKSFDQSYTSKDLGSDLPTANTSMPTASDTLANTVRSSDNDSVLSLEQTNSGESELSSSSMSRSDSPPVEGPASPPSSTCSASSFHEKNKNKDASMQDQIDSVPSLKQTDSEESDKSSSLLSKSDSRSNEWLTAVQGDNSSYTFPPKSTIEERKCSIERSGGFLSTALHCDTEEDSEPSSEHLQKKRTFLSDDAFSTSSEEEDEEEEKEEKQIEILPHLSPEQRSSNLLSFSKLVDAGYGPSMDDLVWLEQKIREKKIAEAMKKRDEFDVNTNLDD